MIITENNNSFVDFKQIWPNYVYTEAIPLEPPALSEAASTTRYENPDGTVYSVSVFTKKYDADNQELPHLVYVNNIQLVKEFRQLNIWKLKYKGDEESLRRVIFPGTTTNRNYTPMFMYQGRYIPYTSLAPKFNLQNCNIEVHLDLSELHFSGWLYVGKSLQDVLATNELPFDDELWLIQDKNNGNRARFNVTEEKVYELPPDNPTHIPDDKDMVVTTNVFNYVLNEIGNADEGEYW